MDQDQAAPTVLFVDACTFEQNEANDFGGALAFMSAFYVSRTSQAYGRVNACNFTHNAVYAINGGGGGALFAQHRMDVNACRFIENHAWASEGGAMAV